MALTEEEYAAWTCPMCGENYRFQTHPFCLKKALKERDEARIAAYEILYGWYDGGNKSMEEKVKAWSWYPWLADIHEKQKHDDLG